jgi:hypothetical protein
LSSIRTFDRFVVPASASKRASVTGEAYSFPSAVESTTVGAGTVFETRTANPKMLRGASWAGANTKYCSPAVAVELGLRLFDLWAVIGREVFKPSFHVGRPGLSWSATARHQPIMTARLDAQRRHAGLDSAGAVPARVPARGPAAPSTGFN